ncbi:ATP-binding cassette domain-containing protein [uncultured Roseibium sp.]|uniref:ATP-binding cassette domain-containing protein n=1 Tax=uncultured Roseibium sp. TaxID=1936171 RepID=UPI00260A39D0|nr:ATP-binding cassette domain-containing protein [uncultured Roseibium sp.]
MIKNTEAVPLSEVSPAPMQAINGSAGSVALAGITKDFGPTRANDHIDIVINPGEVLGLVGGNGAGKSTLMKILSGAVTPTSGSIAFDGEDTDFERYNTAAAQARGIRMVHQELSLCTNLSVAENFFLESPDSMLPVPGWRSRHRVRAATALDDVFPDITFRVDDNVGRLSISERQMVEIARAAATPGVRLIVLDEPTSSLDQTRSMQLREFVRRKASEGMAFIFISHKLEDIIDIATRVVVLRNGRLAWQGASRDATIEHLVELMGGDVNVIHQHAVESKQEAGQGVIRLTGGLVEPIGHPIEIRHGEIVGLAGLEGNGQRELLHAVFAPRGSNRDVERDAAASFIAGDRQKEGVFSQWNVLANISIGRIAGRFPLGFVSDADERKEAAHHAARLGLDEERFNSNILELSGGNQQKALVARALAADTPILLLDDPTRGVDVATKQDFYKLCNNAAKEGRILIWYTTEDAELLAADRVLVFSGGKIVRELVGEEISEETIVGASFAHASESRAEQTQARSSAAAWATRLVDAAPFIGLALVLTAMISLNPRVASTFGMDLLLLPALSLVLVTAAQMFIIGGSEIDLGVGAFAGLISVLAATVLYTNPLLGAGAILLTISLYASMGALIQVRKIPAIVVTLGASFIWAGLGLTIQPTPGGTSPDWLRALVTWSLGGIPKSVVLITIAAVIIVLIDRSPLGVVLRGFGNNPQSAIRSGWSAVRFAVVRYFIAGVFAGVAGLSLTAINTASDINAGNSFTLLSVAAAVMGGCLLLGGVISPIGVVAGAVTLSLIGALLGMLNVSSDYYIATQGIILIVLLALRSLVSRERKS